jgi:large repetitive protein
MGGIMQMQYMYKPPAGGSVWTGTTTGLQLNYLNAPGSGNTWTDASGNGRNGTVQYIGSGTKTYTASNGGGLVLGPTNNINAAMISSTYNLTVPFTVEVIVNTAPQTGAYWASLFGNDSYFSSLGWFAYWSNASTLAIGSTSRMNLYNTVPSSTGAVRQFIVTVDGTPSAQLYVNGTLQTPISTGYGLAPSPASNGLNFGSRHPNAGTSNTPTDCMPGTYYQMRAYNIALNQSQVTANYNAVKTTYGI